MAKKSGQGEVFGRDNAVVTVQWLGLKVVLAMLVLSSGIAVGKPVLQMTEALSLNLEHIVRRPLDRP